MSTAHILKLIYGPKDAPLRTLDLTGTATNSDNLFLAESGLNFSTAEKEIVWSEDYQLGQRRIRTRRKNSRLSIATNWRANTTTALRNLQERLHRFFLDCEQYEDHRHSNEVWLVLRWADDLTDLDNPVYGLSLDRFIRLREIAIPKWPADLFSTLLREGRIQNVVIEAVADPFVEALEIEAMAGTAVLGYDTGVTFSADEMSGDFTVLGWIKHQASDYVAWEYYVDATHYIRLEWDESDSRFELTYNTGAGAATSNCSTSSHTAATWVHLAFIRTGALWQVYVNDTQRLSEASGGSFSNNGTFRLGQAASVGTAANNNVDGWRVWDDNITVPQIGQLYDNEYPIKSTSLTLAPNPYCKTRTTRQVDAVDGVVSAAAKDNYAVVVNVPGDAPAKCRLEFDPPTAGVMPFGYVISRNAQDDTFTPLASTFLDFSGTADAGASSGDAYEASGTVANFDFDAAVTSPAAIRGDINIYGRIKATVASAKAVPYVQYGLSRPIKSIDATTIAPDAEERLYKLGSMRVDWPQSTTPPTVKAGLQIEAVSSNSLLDGLVAFWPMHEAAGVRFDKAGNHHLSDPYSAGTMAGKIGLATDFANSSYLVSEGKGNLALSGDFSISLWVKFNNIGNDAIFGKNANVDYGKSFYFRITTTPQYQWYVSADGISFTTLTAGTPATGAWKHIYLYHDSGTEIGMSINNAAASTIAHTGGVYQSITDLTVGCYGLGNLLLDGGVQMMGIWNRLLTTAERTALYNGGNGVDYPFATTSVNLDFLNVLARPTCEIRGAWPDLASGDTIRVEGQEAWTEDASDSDSQLNKLDFAGDEITLLPNKYNYLTILMGANGTPYTVTPALTNFKCFVTPRWQLL